MRNLLIGALLGIFLTSAWSVTAKKNGPEIRGESGTLNYEIVIDGEVVCSDPWVSVSERVIECNEVGDTTPQPKKKPFISKSRK